MKRNTKTKEQRLIQDWREYNKLMRRCRSKEKTLDEYKRYRAGRQRGRRLESPTRQGSSLINRGTNHRELYPSAMEGGQTPARPEKRYTGDLIKGIAVTHKSNLVPVSSQEQAEDIAKMRRN